MTLAVDDVADVLARHLPIYRLRKPFYQARMLETLRRLWSPEYRRVLDIGGGTGVIAQTIKELFPVERVVSIDVENRYLPSLTIEHGAYGGVQLPFPSGEFDCILFNNVIHHVSPPDRAPLLRECRRVAPNGVLLIKDHVAQAQLDRWRLAALDVIGNVPFQGLVRASYLSGFQWRELAAAGGYEIEQSDTANYRSGLMAALFPNRLEISMVWRPLVD